MARQQAPAGSVRQAILRGRTRQTLRRPPPQTGLELPPGIRPFLLHGHKAFCRRSRPLPLLALRHTLPGVHQLHERAGRLHRQGRGTVPPHHRQRRAQLTPDHHTQPGARDRTAQQGSQLHAAEP